MHRCVHHNTLCSEYQVGAVQTTGNGEPQLVNGLLPRASWTGPDLMHGTHQLNRVKEMRDLQVKLRNSVSHVCLGGYTLHTAIS